MIVCGGEFYTCCYNSDSLYAVAVTLILLDALGTLVRESSYQSEFKYFGGSLPVIAPSSIEFDRCIPYDTYRKWRPLLFLLWDSG